MTKRTMKILVIGGNGLLGTHTVREAIRRGHQVTILSRSNVDRSEDLGGSVTCLTGNVYDLENAAIEKMLSGQDAVVYSLGLDDREVHKRPAYQLFHHDHVTICMRMVEKAKQCGVRKFIVYGSYFTYFNQEYPELRLSEKNVYVRTRLEQKEAVLASSTKEFETFVFELPYIIGYLPGRFPPWTFLFSLLKSGKKNVLFFGRGGTAVVTANQVGQATLGAIENGVGGKSYPISGGNLTWKDFARIYFEASGQKKRVMGIPKSVFILFGVIDSVILFFRNRERGLSLANYAALQFRDAFVDPSLSINALQFTREDCEVELKKMISAWIESQGEVLQDMR